MNNQKLYTVFTRKNFNVFYCVAFLLNSTMEQFLKVNSISAIIQKCRTVFAKVLKKTDIDLSELWSQIFDLINSIFTNSNLTENAFESTEWELLKSLKKTLDFLKNTVAEFCTEPCKTIAERLPYLYVFKHFLQQINVGFAKDFEIILSKICLENNNFLLGLYFSIVIVDKNLIHSLFL